MPWRTAGASAGVSGSGSGSSSATGSGISHSIVPNAVSGSGSSRASGSGSGSTRRAPARARAPPAGLLAAEQARPEAALGLLGRGGRAPVPALGLGQRLRLGSGSTASARLGLRHGRLRLRLGVRGGLRRVDREHHARPPPRRLEPDGPARAVRLPFDSGLGVHLRDPDLPELAEMASQGPELGQLCPQLGGRLDEGPGSLKRTHAGSFRHGSHPSSRPCAGSCCARGAAVRPEHRDPG